MRRRSAIVPALAFALAFALVSCAREKVSQEQLSALFGPYTATGTITATGASLYRRGTHVLLEEGHPLFFLESKTLDLNEYQGIVAVVRGELAPNTHPSFLPVLAAESVTPLGGEKMTDLQRYDAPALHLSLEAPRKWASVIEGASLRFTAPGESSPFLVIVRGAHADVPADSLPVRIGGRNGMRTVGGAIIVPWDDESAIVFTFTPQGAQSLLLRDAFYALLTSVRFTVPDEEGSASSSSSVPNQGPLIPCGGPAHVLCPAGEYCDVRELDTGIGVCRPL